jgi:hypothetical protein
VGFGAAALCTRLMHLNMANRKSAYQFQRYRPPNGRSIQMLDLIMLAIGLGFFMLAVGYTYACDRL